MPSFKKKDLEIIDFTHLKKRGLIKETQEITQPSQEFLDMTSQQQTQNQNPLSFLDALATNTSQNTTSQTNNSELTIKLENLEYQLERLTEKLSTIEEKIAKFEERVK